MRIGSRRAHLLALCAAVGLVATASTTTGSTSPAAGGVLRLSGAGTSPRIAADGAGNLLVVWVEERPAERVILGRMLRPAAEGPAVGPLLRLNRSALERFEVPAIAGATGEGFVVAWVSRQGERSVVVAQWLDGGGSRVGPELRLSGPTSIERSGPRLALAADGSLVAAWQEQIYPNPLVAFVRVSPGDTRRLEQHLGDGEVNYASAVAAYPRGFGVAWSEYVDCSGGRPSQTSGGAALFATGGEEIGRIFAPGRGCGESSGIAALLGGPAGPLAIVSRPDGYFSQRFDAAGAPARRRFLRKRRCPPEGTCTVLASVALDDRGRLALVWQLVDRWSGTLGDSYLQLVDAADRPLGGPQLVATPESTQSATAVAISGRTAAVVWTLELQPPERLGVFARLVSLPAP